MTERKRIVKDEAGKELGFHVPYKWGRGRKAYAADLAGGTHWHKLTRTIKEAEEFIRSGGVDGMRTHRSGLFLEKLAEDGKVLEGHEVMGVRVWKESKW